MGGVYNFLCFVFQDETNVACFRHALMCYNPVACYYAVFAQEGLWKTCWSEYAPTKECLDCIWIISFTSYPFVGLITIGQFDPISIPTSWFSSSGGILSPIFFRCCHLSATDRDGIWSFLDEIVSHIRFREFGLCTSVRASTSNSSIQAIGITLRPCIVLKLRIVLIPLTLSLFFVLFITIVFILVSSKSAYVLTSLLGLSLWYRTTCTIRQMMVAFDVPTELGDADGIWVCSISWLEGLWWIAWRLSTWRSWPDACLWL